MDVVATQSSSSAPVEVSWSPPSGAAPAISGYRIFYGNGQSVFAPSYVTRIVLNFVDSSQIESVSIRSESTQLPSQLITATVTTAGIAILNKPTKNNSNIMLIIWIYCIGGQSSSDVLCTCSREISIAVGAVILIVGIIATVTAITVAICWLVMRY